VPEPGHRALELARKSFGRLAAQIVRKGLTESDDMKPKALKAERREFFRRGGHHRRKKEGRSRVRPGRREGRRGGQK
jgi:hypothetical protein